MSSSGPTPGSNNTNLNDFYDAAPVEPHLLYQGEILIDVPILSMPLPSRWLLLRTWSGLPLDEALNYGAVGNRVRALDSNQSQIAWDAAHKGDFAMGILYKRPVLVLNQNCDVEDNKYLQVAPIYSAEAEQRDLEKLKSGNIFSAFWIKSHPPEIPDESYADFELMQAVHKSYIKRPLNHFRLNSERIQLLQRAITRYFGRPNSYDSRSDKVPETQVYLCVSCFYLDGKATPISLTVGGDFPVCEICGGTAWARKR